MDDEMRDFLDEYYNSNSTVQQAILKSGLISNYADVYDILNEQGLSTQ